MPDPDRAALEAALTSARATVARLEAAIGHKPFQRFDVDRLVPVKVVAKQLGRTAETIRSLARDQNLGCEVGGTWFIDRDRFADYLNRRA